jgi:two-component system phosphate regulon sensor histidine kinase PhoR
MTLGQRLTLGATVLVGLLLVVLVAILDERLHGRLLEESRTALEREARLVAGDWREGTDADSLADAAAAATGHRVTLVDPAGRVVGDSDFDQPALAALENHAARPEIVEARGAGSGSSIRLSSSIGAEELYVAVRDGAGIVRLAVTTRSIDEIFERTRREVLLAGFIALLLSMGLAWLFARAVTRPVVELRDVARAIAEGDLARRPSLAAPGEVGDLAAALHRMAEQLGLRLAAVEKEEALLSALVGSLNEGVVVIDARRTVTRANERARQLLRLPAAAPYPLDVLPRERVLREAIDAALAGEGTDAIETEVLGCQLALTARPLAAGGATVALFDLTPVRRLEAVRRDFVANVSHELRTPLTVVSGFAETLANDDPVPELRKQFADTILAHTERMQRIVDDLLDLSRIESGGWVPVPVPCDVAAIATDCFTSVRRAAEAKGLALRAEIDPAVRTVTADPTALRQVLGNLVDNAVRHTSHGSVTVFTQREGERDVVGVRDTGNGIPAEHLPRIFERFYRADPARSRDAGGTGLGLAIVKHLVEAHGGRVQAESLVGRGTTVRVLLPRAR